MEAIYKRKTMASGEIIVEFYSCEILREMKNSVEVRLHNWFGDGNEKNPVKKIRKQNIRLANKACSGRLSAASQQALFEAWKSGQSLGVA